MNSRACSGLGVNITPDLVNDFFSIKPKSQKNVPLKFQKHHSGTSSMSRASTTGGVTPGNAFNVHDVQYFEQQLKFGGYDEPRPEPRFEEVNDLLLPEPVDEEYHVPVPQGISTEVYDNYSFEHNYDDTLPITEEQERIVQTIEANRVTIIQGSTGSGKTTQVPQYILDHYREKRQFCNILVTQPRRIAAISVATRVADERKWPPETIVGYQIQLQNRVSEDTRITYLTTGVLLQKMIKNKNLNDYTHVILDEVHERDQDIDFAMLIVKQYLRSVSKHVKVVLMSATADCTLFSNYFAMLINSRREGAPVITVEGNIYDVSEYYFEDLHSLSETPQQSFESPDIDEKNYALCKEIILALDKDELKEDFVPGRVKDKRGSVLVFLPGRHEIETMHKYLDEFINKRRLKIMVLHSDISSTVQAEVFHPAKQGERKVILSTNIAESSITVPDVRYVIDFCLTKQSEVDRDTKFNRLVLKWASKASLIQRRGRAGRTADGHCFRLISKFFYDELDEHSEPEMQRASLEQLILQVKLLDLGPPPGMVLQLAIQPPRVSDIKKTILLLKEVGALTLYQNGKMNALDGDLTFVGRVLGDLPVEVHLGKLLLIGYAFGMLEECLVIAACLSLKSLFTKQFRKELDIYRNKMFWASETSCDMLTSLIVFLTWKFRKLGHGFDPGYTNRPRERNLRGEDAWAKKHCLELKRLHEIDDLVEKLRKDLLKFNMQTHRNIYSRERWDHNKKKMCISQHEQLILKVIMAGAFYPNYFLSVPIEEAEATKAMSGWDPCTTVVCHGAPTTLKYYKTQVAKLFRMCGNGKSIHFENTKFFVEFEKDLTYLSPVLPQVLIALKMRQLRMPLNILISKKKDEEARKEMETYNPATGMRTNRVHIDLNDLSGKLSVTMNNKQVKLQQNEHISIIVEHMISPSHFWAIYESSHHIRHQMNTTLNRLDGKDLALLEESDYKVGALCCAEFEEMFFRAEIKQIQMSPLIVEVFFVDYGNTEFICRRELIRKCPDQLDQPYQAFECFLAEIRPVQGTWTEQAKRRFKEIVPIGRRVVTAKVYSIVHNAYRLILSVDDENINALLVKELHATHMDESLISKTNHEEMSRIGSSREVTRVTSMHVDDVNIHECPDAEVQRVSLRGPFSPYELEFNGITAQARLKGTRISTESVNSVLIKDEPQDSKSRLLVAATCMVNPRGNSFNARDTCLMPNIHGLASILALLFTPEAELRCDKKKTCVIGALCGLGSEKLGDRGNKEEGIHGILPDDEIEIAFDVKIDADDLIKINCVRHFINEIIGVNSEVIEWAPQKVVGYQQMVQERLKTLIIDTIREDMEPVSCNKEYRWKLVDEESLLHCGFEASPEHLYVYHDAIFFEKLDEEVDPRLRETREKLAEFHSKAGNSSVRFTSEVVCPVCQVVCRNPTAVYMHSESPAHRNWVSTILCPEGEGS